VLEFDQLDSLAQFSHKIPPLPAFVSREWIYQDRDYMAIASCLVDTNILLRISRRSDPQHKLLMPRSPSWRWQAPLFTTLTRILPNCGM
jgi:hypothetical protein